MVPAPMKPIPDTTCAAIRDTSKRMLGSFNTPSKPKAETIMNKAEPKATKKWVRRPAAFSRYSRSKPMKPPKSAATKMRIINSNVSIILSFTIVVANLHKKKEACNLSRYKFNHGTKKGSKRAYSPAIGCPSSPINTTFHPWSLHNDEQMVEQSMRYWLAISMRLSRNMHHFAAQ